MKKMIPVFEKYGVKKASLFGSLARGEDKPESDVDILVEFDRNRPMGLFGYIRFGRELTKRAGRKVDVVSKLNKHMAPYIKNDLRMIYGQE